MGLNQAAQDEPVCRSENDAYHSVESDTVDATPPKQSADPARVPKPFNPDAVCETTVNDVLAVQPLQDSITTAPPASQEVNAQKAKKKGRERVSGSLTSNPSGRTIGLGRSFEEFNRMTMSTLVGYEPK